MSSTRTRRRTSSGRSRPRRRRSRASSALKGCMTTLLVIGIACFFGLKAFLGWVNPYLPASWDTCRVNDKDRTATAHDGKSDARIYTDQCGVMVVKDALLRGNSTSADLYGKIHRGRTYRIQHAGKRVGFFSVFPVVLKVQPVKKGHKS